MKREHEGELDKKSKKAKRNKTIMQFCMGDFEYNCGGLEQHLEELKKDPEELAAELKEVDDWGDTPLACLCYYIADDEDAAARCIEMIGLLIEAGADLDSVNNVCFVFSIV